MQLGGEALTGGAALLPRSVQVRAIDTEVPGYTPADQRIHHARRQPARGAEVRGEGAQEEGRVGEHVLEREEAQVRPELLVEEVLDLQCAAPVDRIVGIERRFRIAPFELADDEGRVADDLPVELEHRERGPGP